MEGGTTQSAAVPRPVRRPLRAPGGRAEDPHGLAPFQPRTISAGLDSLSWVHRPVRVRCTPEWYARTEAIPHLIPASTRPDDRFESYHLAVVDGPKSFFARREIIDEYGWRNFGDVYADHEAEHYEGEPPVISHYNNQYDLVLGMLLQYLRTGRFRWFDLADPLARHVIDIDIYHTDRDKAAYNGGLFWHTEPLSGCGDLHPSSIFSAQLQPGDPFRRGGPSSNHNYSTGLLHYHYLTGDPKAREAVIGLADWVVNMDDGRAERLRDAWTRGPTGLATHPGEPDYQGPCRGAGNSINALIDGWLFTGRSSYLDKAEALIRRSHTPTTTSRGSRPAERRAALVVHRIPLLGGALSHR